MEAIEQAINIFLDKYVMDGVMRDEMNKDLHFLVRTIIKAHNSILEPEAYRDI